VLALARSKADGMRCTLLLALVMALAACGDDGSGDGDSGPATSSSSTSGDPGTGGAGGTGGALVGGGSATGGAAVGGAGTGGNPDACPPGLPVVSFTNDVQPIFTASCAKTNCHKGSAPDVGLDLAAGNAHADLVGVTTAQCQKQRTRIIPGDPDESYLLDKVRGVDLCDKSARMPLQGMKLSEEKIAIIQAWICGGALED